MNTGLDYDLVRKYCEYEKKLLLGYREAPKPIKLEEIPPEEAMPFVPFAPPGV